MTEIVCCFLFSLPWRRPYRAGVPRSWRSRRSCVRSSIGQRFWLGDFSAYLSRAMIGCRLARLREDCGDTVVCLHRDIFPLYPMYSIGPATYRAKAITSSGGSPEAGPPGSKTEPSRTLAPHCSTSWPQVGAGVSAGASERTPQL